MPQLVAPVKAPDIAKADPALLKDCDLPVDLGNQALPKKTLEKDWRADRGALLECRGRHHALAGFIVDRDAQLRGIAEGAR